MERRLYPFKFAPILKDKIWGGDKLHAELNKVNASNKCGESWEVSGVPGDVSVVSNGWFAGNSLTEAIEVYMGDLVGEKVFEKHGAIFPLLIKFIDANNDLSIQVHPDDELALERHKSYGKTEMWYVIDAAKNSRIMVGFNKELSKQEYLTYLKNGEIEMISNYEPTSAGDVYFIPAGRVHAICSGTVIAEIQQTSDITYRIYDYMRKDDQGKERELHTELALDAIDFKCYDSYKTQYEEQYNHPVNLASCQYFTTNIINCNTEINRDLGLLDSFVIYICLEGKLDLVCESEIYKLEKGETVLIPAIIEGIALHPHSQSKLLEVYVEEKND